MIEAEFMVEWRHIHVCLQCLISSGKSAGQDKKLYKKMKSEDETSVQQERINRTSFARYSYSRILYYLIACLNQIFPDYDFR